MKTKFSITCLIIFTNFINAQEVSSEKYTAHNKGKFYIFWGGNRDYYTNSDITFTGKDYKFTLENVEAHDKPKGYHVDYVNPARMTIPQTNFRMGYFINDHYNISIGLDHMKYVMDQNQVVNYTGNYQNEGTNFYGETLPNGQVLLTEDFLTFEHTDGLNYINSEFCRVDDISKLFGIRNTDKFQINLTEGLGAGLLYPKTNAKLMQQERHDDFHVSGYGISAKAGLNFTFYKYFFIQTEIKGGYINMNSIQTTNTESEDEASQDFNFSQTVIAFGGIFRL
ncbi:hypothetical protein [Flavobacterium sp.]|jgi:hypothetical protein|uniref:hypothetical protein n=1 Tax=Flavobacterium sp. TaxID=239 RepID=UPI0037BF8A43